MLLEVKDIQVYYGAIHAIKGVSFEVNEGEIVTLIGANGAGKTTLIRALLGQVEYKGVIRHLTTDGRPAADVRTGYVPQQLEFDRSSPVTVTDFMAASLSRRPVFLGVSKKTREKVMAALARTHSERLCKRPLGALSGGLGQLIYKNADCGHYLLVFAPSVVMLYLDAMVDGMLKGFGEQTACVRYNVFTSVLDVALLYLLLPRFGMMAYVLTFYFTHAVNFWLSLHRLQRVTGYRLDGKFLPRAVFCALSGLGGSCCLPDGGLLPAMVLRAGLFASVFLLFLEFTDTVPAQDRQWLQKSLRLRRGKCG